MQNHPFLTSMSTFRELAVKDGIVMECTYHFELGHHLAPTMANLSHDIYVHIKLNEDGSFKIDVLPEECSGWRLKFGHFHLYLSTSEEDNAIDGQVPAHIFKLHRMLVGGRIYYPYKEDILNYWKFPDDNLNGAELYFEEDQNPRSLYLVDIIKKNCGPISSALELGCNVGRNLNYIRQEFGANVGGIEISEHALSVMKETYPALRDCKTYAGDMTDAINKIDDNSFDLVFSMAVLMHLHPTVPDSFWPHIVRIAKKYIITIENESGASNRNWERNYRDLLEPCGAKQIYEARETPIISKAYVTRVFRCDKKER